MFVSCLTLTGASAAGLGFAWFLYRREFYRRQSGIKEFFRASYNSPPPSWTGPIFTPKLDYPLEEPPNEQPYPWETIDFRKNPEEYLKAVLDYCFEGNLENDFVPQKNLVRKWYHAPWMCQSSSGREPIHGLTFERPAQQGYLGKSQKKLCQVWAVAMYNEAGAYILGKVWEKKYKPNTKPFGNPVRFPIGTVSFKLLFSQANANDLSFLDGSPAWKATIARKPLDSNGPSNDRTEPTDLHLLQVDVAVRDRQADDTTGWVFGTLMYHSSIKSSDTPWKRLMPVCLMWGNDPSLSQKKYNEGDRPKESWINPDAVAALEIPNAKRKYLGWLDRGNGPVDNYRSSCISCHSTANSPKLAMTYSDEDEEDRKMRFFRNLFAGEPFECGGHPLDYSLQLMVGIDNNKNWRKHWSSFFDFKWKKPSPPLPPYPVQKNYCSRSCY